MGGVDGLWHRQVGPGRILEDYCIGRAGQTRLGPSNSQVWQVGKGIWRGGPGRLTRLGTAEGRICRTCLGGGVGSYEFSVE